ncbi:MAG: thioredoxin [Planctomycetaceae bacterium]|jgi:thioredoxin 1|nr:thioredoxin [Planctomycetaceae bacterium]MDR1271178.1 thioredoxin [Planctomycetaceae bacterium]
MESILELTETDFEQNVLKSKIPVLVDFWSPSCRPCRMIAPILEELAKENDGDAKIAKINIAQFPQIGAKFGVEMLPTLLFFNKGIVVERMIGAQPKNKLQNALDEIE